MPDVRLDDESIAVDASETVLDALLRRGIDVPFSCRSGACQSCLMRVTEGSPPPTSQAGLKSSLKLRGYFLPCICKPTCDLVIARPNGEADTAPVDARVVGIEALSRDVARLRLRTAGGFDYRAGQFVNLMRPDGLVRSYSLASLSQCDEDLELHVRRIPAGRMSNWLHDQVKAGDVIQVRGPAGDCFYTPDQPQQDILLVGTGTGLAPLVGILRDALHQGHCGRIHLFHGAWAVSGFYLVDELTRLAQQHPHQVTYTRCLQHGDTGVPPTSARPLANVGLQTGAIDRIVLDHLPKLTGWRVYLCGNPDMVLTLRKMVFLAGAGMKDIHSDAFIMTKS